MGDFHSSHHRPSVERPVHSHSGSPFLAHSLNSSADATSNRDAAAATLRSLTPSPSTRTTTTTAADQGSLLNVILPAFIQSEQQQHCLGTGLVTAGQQRSPSATPSRALRQHSSPVRSVSRRPSNAEAAPSVVRVYQSILRTRTLFKPRTYL